MLSWILDRIYEGSGHCRKNTGTLMDMLYAIFSSTCRYLRIKTRKSSFFAEYITGT